MDDTILYLPEVVFKVVSSNQEADELVDEGFEDFRLYNTNARRYLDKGAIAFCVYTSREFAHIGWTALTEEAGNALWPFPIHINYPNEALCEHAFTIPKFRRMGVSRYKIAKRNQFLKEKGVGIIIATVRTNNPYSQQLQNRLGSTLYAKARFIRILWWKYWKEMPVTSNR